MTSTFYPPYHLGGDAVHVKYLAEALVKMGHEVHVIHSLDAFRVKSKKKSEPESSNVHVHTLDSPYGKLTPMKAYAFGNSKFIFNNFRDIVKQVKPDVVHHHNISLLGHGILKRQGDYSQIYTAHDHWLICQKNDFMKNGQICEDRRCGSCAISLFRPPQFWRKRLDVKDIDCLICPSEYMASRLEELEISTQIMPNFSPEPPEIIPDIPDENFFLYLGVIDEHKGIRELVNAFAESKNKLIIIGTGPMEEWVKNITKEKKLAPRIECLGWMTDGKWPYLKKANALLVPSTGQENCPLVALEAMSVGTPVISSDMGGTKEVAGNISPDYVLQTESLEEKLRNIQKPDISRDAVKQIFNDNYSESSYLERYLKLAKGEF